MQRLQLVEHQQSPGRIIINSIARDGELARPAPPQHVLDCQLVQYRKNNKTAGTKGKLDARARHPERLHVPRQTLRGDLDERKQGRTWIK